MSNIVRCRFSLCLYRVRALSLSLSLAPPLSLARPLSFSRPLACSSTSPPKTPFPLSRPPLHLRC